MSGEGEVKQQVTAQELYEVWLKEEYPGKPRSSFDDWETLPREAQVVFELMAEDEDEEGRQLYAR